MNGQIFRVVRESGYTILDTTCLRDKKLKNEAKGLHSFIMQLPTDWKITIAGLAACSADCPRTIARLLKVLVENDYMRKHRVFDNRGRIVGYKYFIFQTKEDCLTFSEKQGGDTDVIEPVSPYEVVNSEQLPPKESIMQHCTNGNCENLGTIMQHCTCGDCINAIMQTINNESILSIKEIDTHTNARGEKNEMSVTDETQTSNDSFTQKRVEQECVCTAAPEKKSELKCVTKDQIDECITEAKAWCKNNRAKIEEWKVKANYSGSILERNEIERFFQYWMSAKGEAHPVFLNPLQFFEIRFRTWLFDAKEYSPKTETKPTQIKQQNLYDSYARFGIKK